MPSASIRMRHSSLDDRGYTRYCAYCNQPATGEQDDSHAQCRLWATTKPRAGNGSPSIHDVPLHLSESTIHRYIDRGGREREGMRATMRRNPEFHRYYLLNRTDPDGTPVLDLGALLTGSLVHVKA